MNEGLAPRDHLIEHNTQAEDIGPGVDAVGFAASLLGAHVGRGAGETASLARPLAAQGQAKIAQVGPPSGIEQDIGRFDVAVDQPVPVGAIERVGNGDSDPHRLPEVKRLALDAQLQIAAANPLGDDVAAPVGSPPGVVDRNHSRVVEPRQGSRFGEEGRHAFRLGVRRNLRDLHGHIPGKLAVPGQVNAAESAFTEQVPNTIAADHRRQPVAGGVFRRRIATARQRRQGGGAAGIERLAAVNPATIGGHAAPLVGVEAHERVGVAILIGLVERALNALELFQLQSQVRHEPRVFPGERLGSEPLASPPPPRILPGHPADLVRPAARRITLCRTGRHDPPIGKGKRRARVRRRAARGSPLETRRNCLPRQLFSR